MFDLYHGIVVIHVGFIKTEIQESTKSSPTPIQIVEWGFGDF
jgi:hypothetical protein